MKKQHKYDKFDAFFDVIILAIFVFIVSITIMDPIIRFVLIIAGCGAMFNNIKHIIRKNKKKNNKKDKEKNNNKE